jgi:hypothetical protein
MASKLETEFLLRRAQEEAIAAIGARGEPAQAAHQELSLLYSERAQRALCELRFLGSPPFDVISARPVCSSRPPTSMRPYDPRAFDSLATGREHHGCGLHRIDYDRIGIRR